MSSIGDTDFGLQIGIGFFGKVATAIAGLVASILVARVVGPSSYGVFYIAMSISQFLENPITGWATACKKRMTESEFNTSVAFGSVLLSIAGTVLVGAPISYYFLNLFTQNQVIPVAVPLVLISTSSYWALNTFLSGRDNFSLSVWSGSLNTLIQAIGKVTLVIVGFGIWGIVWGTVVGPILVLPILVMWIDERPSVPSWEDLKSIGEYAKWSIPNGFVGTALSRMDTVLLGWLATAAVAGKYQVGLQITMPAVFISSVIGTGLMGRVSNLESRQREWEDDLWNSLSYSSILSVPIFFGSLVIGEEIAVTVFGSRYSGAGIFVVGLALHRLIKTQISPFKSVIAGLDRPDIHFKISLFSFIVNIILGVSLWWVIGASGIVFATVLTSIGSYLMSIYYFHKISKSSLIYTPPFVTQIVSGVIMATTVYGATEILGIYTWVHIIIYIVIGALTYGGSELFLSSHLRATILGILDDINEKYLA